MKRHEMRIAALLVALAAAAATIACAPRGPVLETIEQMQSVSRSRSQNEREQVRRSVVAAFEAAQQSAQDRVGLRLAEIQVQVYRATEERIGRVTGRVVDELDSVMEGPIDRLHQELQAARGANPNPADRGKELEAAAALGATLAAYGREKAKLVDDVRTRFARVRDEQLAALQARRGELVAKVGIDAEGEADAILAQYFAASEKLDDELDEGFRQIRRYVNSRDIAIRSFSQGLLGERFGKLVADKAIALADEGFNRVSGEIDELGRAAEAAVRRAEERG